MLKSWRFRIAAVLTAVLIICLICRAVNNKFFPPEQNEAALHHKIVTVTTAAKTTAAAEIHDAESTLTAVTEILTEPEYVMTAAEPYLSHQKAEWMKERTALLADTCPDFIGWLFMADTEIDNAVVQGTDNMYYLSHAPDGRELNVGTLFLDYRCDRGFADSTNILFGHNMQSGMFGDISYFEERESFDRHRYGWLMTPQQLYRIDFFALAIVSGYDELYDVPCESKQWIERIAENSVQYRETEFSESDRYIAFSTCSAAFENAREMFTGKLVHVEDNYTK